MRETDAHNTSSPLLEYILAVSSSNISTPDPVPFELIMIHCSGLIASSYDYGKSNWR